MDSPINYKLSDLIIEANKKVIGQPETVFEVSACIYKYCLRFIMNNRFPNYIPNGSNLLIAGDSGTGKTHAVRTICELLKVPFYEINGKSICQEGWSGQSFSEMLVKALEQNKENPSYGVVFVDEIDKIIYPMKSSNNENYNAALQHSMLKYIEGFRIESSTKTMKLNPALKMEPVVYDTNNLCFIFAGAFGELKELVVKTKPIGFVHAKEEEKTFNHYEALIKIGMIPELAGRMTSLVFTNTFTDAMYEHLLDSESFFFNKWKSAFTIMQIDHKDLFNKELVLSKVTNKTLGARALIQECDKIVNSVLELNKSSIDLERVYNNLYRGFLLED